jgi:hypothetical protein
MKTLIRTIMILIVANLIVVGSVFAGNMASEESPDTVGIADQPILPELNSVEPAKAKAKLVKSSGYGSRLARASVSTGRSMFYGSRSGSAGEVLVIPSAEITTEDIAAITEDMNIMSRIFEKNLQENHININSMFFSSSDPFHVALMHGKSSTQGIYLQGYGALFLMKVDFPLSPGPQLEEEQEKESQKEKDADPVWTEFQQQMYEPGESKKEKIKNQEKEYDPEKVENLKTTFIKSLKHAANIRNLKPDESVILTITGSHLSSGYKSVRTIPGRNDVIVIDKNNKTQIITGDRIGDIGLSLPTVLVIRAKKSDIDRFAKGDLDFDQFKQNTQILTSAYLADQSDSGNPFTGYYFDY